MAKIQVSIQSPVGIRNGWAEQPNRPEDLAKICELFDRIPMHLGGTRETPNDWKKERNQLIEQVTQQIIWFQKKQKRPMIDGVVDPHQGTLRVMNEVALDTPLTPAVPSTPSSKGAGTPLPAKVVAPMGDFELEGESVESFVDPNSLPGTGIMRGVKLPVKYWRRLVRVEGTSINWFGVYASKTLSNLTGAIPHINFTPTPVQGGYLDNGYDSFTSWMNFWDDYTYIMGSQIAAAGAQQILVVPFYRRVQPTKIGVFSQNWKDAVISAVTVAVQDAMPMALAGPYDFNAIVSSSFSSGWIIHSNFHHNGRDVSPMTRSLFELDGFGSGCIWVSPKGITFRNRVAPRGQNPEGNVYYVGERWTKPILNQYGHQSCRNYLLYPGLKLRGH